MQLPSFWTMMFKVALLLAVPTFTLGSGWAVWITSSTFENTSRIRVLEYANNNNKAGAHQTTSVNVGAAKEAEVLAEYRDYYTTEEAAKLLKVSERKVQDMCASGSLPASRPDGARAWRIDKSFMVGGNVRLTAASSGTAAEQEKQP